MEGSGRIGSKILLFNFLSVILFFYPHLRDMLIYFREGGEGGGGEEEREREREREREKYQPVASHVP